jgi:hypothetical protein
VFIDEDGVGGSKPAGRPAVQVQADTLTALPESVRPGQYLFLSSLKRMGMTTPSEKVAMTMNNSTDRWADGKRDNMNDSAWTTPVWFAGQTQGFVWSINSDKYHDANCWPLRQLGMPTNEVERAAFNRTKHHCHP